MGHLFSVVLCSGLIVGLATFIETTFRRNSPVIRRALVGTWSVDCLNGAALTRIGTCLRASFPSGGQEGLSEDLSRLVLQLSTRASSAR